MLTIFITSGASISVRQPSDIPERQASWKVTLRVSFTVALLEATEQRPLHTRARMVPRIA